LSIIKPWVEDPKTPADDTSNQRPVAVSQTPFQNVFERMLIDGVEETFQDPNEQFGFKENSSCGHATF